MQLKELKKIQDSLAWPETPENLPIVTWETCELPASHKLKYLATKLVQSRENPNFEHSYSFLASSTMCLHSWTITLEGAGI